jgi:hypothetical protein
MKMEAAPMTIQITKPEVEALINQRLQSGAFKDAEDNFAGSSVLSLETLHDDSTRAVARPCAFQEYRGALRPVARLEP